MLQSQQFIPLELRQLALDDQYVAQESMNIDAEYLQFATSSKPFRYPQRISFHLSQEIGTPVLDPISNVQDQINPFTPVYLAADQYGCGTFPVRR
jgi:hypothetical protein